LLAANEQPSGHELPRKQNGAMPYHLQIGSITAHDETMSEERIRRQRIYRLNMLKLVL
jgi:hypothetical protein